MRRSAEAFFFTVIGAAALAFADQSHQAQVLLKKTFNPPTAAFQGHVTITHWTTNGTRSEEANIYFKPPNLYRWEFLKPDGSVDRVVTSDGKSEQVEARQLHKILSGDPVKSSPKQLSSDDEWNLLLANYDLGMLQEKNVAGRSSAGLEIRPRVQGKPHEDLWLDKRSGVVLEVKRFHPQSAATVMSRFDEFEELQPDSIDKFILAQTPGMQILPHGLDPDFMAMGDLEQLAENERPFPQRLSDGFIFESAEALNVNGHVVHQMHYTDGMCVVSIFESRAPLANKNTTRPARFWNRKKPSSVGNTDDLRMVSWSKDGLNYLMMGDMSRDVMQDIRDSLK